MPSDRGAAACEHDALHAGRGRGGRQDVERSVDRGVDESCLTVAARRRELERRSAVDNVIASCYGSVERTIDKEIAVFNDGESAAETLKIACFRRAL